MTPGAFLPALILLLALPSCSRREPEPRNPQADLLERAQALELETKWESPPGDPLEHFAAGYAKVLCSAVFITGLDGTSAATHVGFFTAPPEDRHKVSFELDSKQKAVRVTLPSGVVRTARLYGHQGCIALPIGEDRPFFEPEKVVSTLPDPSTQAWPMGDLVPDEPLPSEINAGRLKAAVDAAFDPPASKTAAFVVTYRGRIIGERYMEGMNKDTRLESWSMGKSITATLMGVLIQQGVYDLYQPAPIPEWLSSGDPRAEIRIADIMRMSSGLRFRAPQDPDFDPSLGYPDHLYVYTGTVNSFHWAATRPQQWPPNTVGRYRNSDPVLINYLIRLGVEGRGEQYLTFPQRQLFDKLGMRNMVLETDPYGNFLLQGYELGTGSDWARLGNLYLQDGTWEGERILPEGFVEFVSTVAPAWEADGRQIYGAFFWINGDRSFPIPGDAYFMAGAGGQYTIIIPSHQLVVVRLGLYSGSGPGGEALRRSLSLLMEAVPPVAAR